MSEKFEIANSKGEVIASYDYEKGATFYDKPKDESALIEKMAEAIAHMADRNMCLDAYNKPVLYNDEGIAKAALAVVREWDKDNT
jgi:hypothetical protein